MGVIWASYPHQYDRHLKTQSHRENVMRRQMLTLELCLHNKSRNARSHQELEKVRKDSL